MRTTKLVSIFAVISKGQQQTTVQQQQHQQLQQQIGSLFKPPIPQRLSVQIQQQHVHEHRPLIQSGAADQLYYSITFPSSNEDIGNEHLSPPINNANFNNLVAPTTSHRVSETPNINSNFPLAAPSPAPAPYGDNEYDFIRDFAWTLFQGSKIPTQNGNLILSPLLVQMQLSLIRKAATGNFPTTNVLLFV